MSSNTQERLLEKFIEAAGGQLRQVQEVGGNTVELAGSLGVPVTGGAGGSTQELARNVYGTSATTPGANVHSSAPASSGSDSGASTAGSIVGTFFESGFGIGALVKGLVGLFGGGEAAA